MILEIAKLLKLLANANESERNIFFQECCANICSSPYETTFAVLKKHNAPVKLFLVLAKESFNEQGYELANKCAKHVQSNAQENSREFTQAESIKETALRGLASREQIKSDLKHYGRVTVCDAANPEPFMNTIKSIMQRGDLMIAAHCIDQVRNEYFCHATDYIGQRDAAKLIELAVELGRKALEKSEFEVAEYIAETITKFRDYTTWGIKQAGDILEKTCEGVLALADKGLSANLGIASASAHEMHGIFTVFEPNKVKEEKSLNLIERVGKYASTQGNKELAQCCMLTVANYRDSKPRPFLNYP